MAHLADSPESSEDEDLQQDLGNAPAKGKRSRPSPEADQQLKAAIAGWTEALRSVQKSINDAAAAIHFLRETVREMAPLLHSLGLLEEALRGFEGERTSPQRPAELEAEAPAEQLGEDAVPAPQTVSKEEASPDQAWESWMRRPTVKEKPIRWTEPEEEAALAAAGPPRVALKPITLVPDESPPPYSYKVSVEDPGKPVELVPLHQALTTVPAVRNLSLVSYVNGVASIFMEAMEEIQPPELESAIRKKLKRSCSVLPHDESTILIQVGA